jgi:ATP-binding cassette subfamily B protein/subfamily B ATP-binding cassette protein MsbA
MTDARKTPRGWRKYRRLLSYAVADGRGWALIVCVTLLSGAASLLQPWPMKVVVDHVLGEQAEGARALLAWMVLAGLGLFGVGAVADVVLARAWVRIGQGMVYRLAGDLFAHLQRRSLLFHSRNSTGDSLSRVTGDSWCVYKVVEALLFTPLYASVMLASLVVLMARLDPGLTLLALAVAPFLTGTSFLLGGPIRAAARARREVESRLQSHIQQTLHGIQVVQTCAQEEREAQRFEERTGAALKAHRRAALASNLYTLASGLVATLGAGAVLLVGARHVLDGKLSVGGLLVFLAYQTNLQGQLKAFTSLYATLQELGASVDRVTEMLDADLEVKDGPGLLPRLSGHVRLEGVTFGYEPGRAVLREVYLEALPGQTVAIVGQTGAGKSTLAALVARLFDPWQGRVLLDGQDARGVKLASLRSQVAVVLQEPFLFPLSVADNIAYGRPGAARKEIEEAARAANAHDFIARLPEGYDSILGERGGTLSGGERQRLAIARALLRDAPVLLLDEPTSALDLQTEGLLLGALRALMAGRTTLLIAHRLSTLRNADKIVVLDAGRVVETGTHDDLLARGGIYARLYEMQCGPVTGCLAAG